MIKKYTIQLILLLSLLSCNDYSKEFSSNSIIADTVVYNFINSILDDSTINLKSCNKLLLDSTYRTEPYSYTFLDSIVSREDIDFFNQQLKYINEFKLDPNRLPNKLLLSRNSLDSLNISLDSNKRYEMFWDSFHRQYGDGGFCNFNKPIFSKDNSLVIWTVGYQCGKLCGSGGTYIFKKEQNKWKLLMTINQWIS